MYTKLIPGRTFRIPFGASVADPAHLIAVYEILEDGTEIGYRDFEELKKFINEIDPREK